MDPIALELIKKDALEGWVIKCNATDDLLIHVSNDPDFQNIMELSLVFDSCSDLSPLRKLAQLEDLTLCRLDSISDFAAIASLPHLKNIHLGNCSNIYDLSILEKTSAPVKQLTLIECLNFQSLNGARHIPNLEELQLTLCPNLSDISDVGTLKSLKIFDIASCPRVTDISALFGMASIELININCCTGIPQAQIKELKQRLPDCKIIT